MTSMNSSETKPYVFIRDAGEREACHYVRGKSYE